MSNAACALQFDCLLCTAEPMTDVACHLRLVLKQEVLVTTGHSWLAHTMCQPQKMWQNMIMFHAA